MDGYPKRPARGNELCGVGKEVPQMDPRTAKRHAESPQKPEFGCSRKRVHRQMQMAGVSSVRRRAYKRTTNSNHSHPITPNQIQRSFKIDRSEACGIRQSMSVGAIPTISLLFLPFFTVRFLGEGAFKNFLVQI